MDALTGLPDGPAPSGAFLLRIVLDPPWSIRVAGRLAAVPGRHGQRRGVDRDVPGEETRLRPGDVAIIRGSEPYLLADDPATRPQVLVHPGQRCATPDGRDLHEQMALGVRTWGSDPNGSMTMLLGVYEQVGAVGQRLLSALPRVLVVSAGTWDPTLIALLGREITQDAPGQDVLLDRLLDLLLISVLRVWLDRPGAEGPAWYAALGHPVVGRALRLLHEDRRARGRWPRWPTEPASRGGPGAQLHRAGGRGADDLPRGSGGLRWPPTCSGNRRPPWTRSRARSGTETASLLSTAFTRVRGVSPREHRTGGRGPPAPLTLHGGPAAVSGGQRGIQRGSRRLQRPSARARD
jgi:hypothetical protein